MSLLPSLVMYTIARGGRQPKRVADQPCCEGSTRRVIGRSWANPLPADLVTAARPCEGESSSTAKSLPHSRDGEAPFRVASTRARAAFHSTDRQRAAPFVVGDRLFYSSSDFRLQSILTSRYFSQGLVKTA